MPKTTGQRFCTIVIDDRRPRNISLPEMKKKLVEVLRDRDPPNAGEIVQIRANQGGALDRNMGGNLREWPRRSAPGNPGVGKPLRPKSQTSS